MSGRRGVLERIAAALERLAKPVGPPQNWLSAPAYVWAAEEVIALSSLDALPLQTLRGIDEQKGTVLANLTRFSQGAAAHDMLLWGARGMGKSALIRAAVADIQREAESALALFQIGSDALDRVPALIAELAEQPRAFLLFIDDLGFDPEQRQTMLALRSLLDGGLVARPANIRIAVTSNRRAIVTRDAAESNMLHARDERDDALALADRFGVTLGFHPCDRETYVEIVRSYTDPLGLSVDDEEALAWAIARGNRSGRTALQFATELAGRAGLALNPTRE